MTKEKKIFRGRWSQNEVKLLRRLFASVKTQKIADKLGRPLTAVRQKAYELGLKTNKFRPWSKDDVELLKKLYPNKRTPEVADELGRSLRAIMGKAQKMGLKKTKKYLKSLGRA